MAKPYLMDLRERVVGAVERGGMSRHQAAGHFSVAVSTAIKWVQRFRQAGSAIPGQMGGHKPKAIAGPTGTGSSNGAGCGTSRCADWSRNWPSTAA